MSLVTIKEAIKANLDALVVSGVLVGATITDIRKDPLAADHPGSPWAYLMPPSIDSEVLDNRTVLRSYTFGIMVIVNAQNIESTTELEDMVENILTKFDNDPTLSGTAHGGVLPVSSSPVPYQHNGKDLIMVVIEIVAKHPVSLSFA